MSSTPQICPGPRCCVVFVHEREATFHMAIPPWLWVLPTLETNAPPHFPLPTATLFVFGQYLCQWSCVSRFYCRLGSQNRGNVSGTYLLF